jgi:hypothetical protein
MPPISAINVAAALWLVAGLGIAIALIIVVFKEFDSEDEALPYLALGGIGLAEVGLLVLATYLLFPGVVLWAWRVSAVLYVVMALIAATRVGSSPLARAAAAGNVLLAIAMAATSIDPGDALTRPAVASSAPPALLTVITIDGVKLWHGVAIGLLGLGTLTFLLLFIRAMERGDSPAFESHWGGIGGGIGGWRMSTSLTYVMGAAVFGLLFAVFIFTLGNDPSTRSAGNPPAAPAGTLTTNSPPASAPPARAATPPATTPGQ